MGLDAERTQVRVIAEERVRELIRTRGIDPMRDHDAIRDAIEQTVADAVGEALASGEALRIDPVQLALEVQHAVAGFGPLQRFFDDPTVEEIWINEPGRVFVARAGRSELTTVVLTDREVRDLVERMLRISGRRLDTSSPFVDAMLPDGSRLAYRLNGATPAGGRAPPPAAHSCAAASGCCCFAHIHTRVQNLRPSPHSYAHMPHSHTPHTKTPIPTHPHTAPTTRPVRAQACAAACSAWAHWATCRSAAALSTWGGCTTTTCPCCPHLRHFPWLCRSTCTRAASRVGGCWRRAAWA